MPKTKGKHGEVAAMGMVETALVSLGEEECARIIRWATERFCPSIQQVPRAGQEGRQIQKQTEDPIEVPQDASELYSQAAPETEQERALVVAYWVQEVQGKGEFDSQTVNSQLKNLGHGVSNITRALDDLKKQKPQLVIQIEKSGRTKQARKRYKVTVAGKAEVKKMLSGTAEA
jgi:hypothetical protein